jgi:threonine synthase
MHYSYSRICSEALERVSDNAQQDLILAAREVYLEQEAIAAKLAESFTPIYRTHKTCKTDKQGEPVYVRKLTGYKCAGCNATMAKPKCIRCEQEAICNQ